METVCYVATRIYSYNSSNYDSNIFLYVLLLRVSKTLSQTVCTIEKSS